MAETDRHRLLMIDLLQSLEDWFTAEPEVYVSGNLLLFYEEGNKRRHVSPDVFVVFGVPKHRRENYLLWEEKRGPNIVIELTSSSTRREDTRKKLELYRDVLRVPEYFLFDPYGDYLNPRFQGHRLTAGEYRPMRLEDGQIRSRQLDLILKTEGQELRLFDPTTGNRLPTRAEARLAANRAQKVAEEVTHAAEAAKHAANLERMISEKARAAAEAEVERLRTELAALRRKNNGA
jgi:Uma2 family endonuclease